MSKFANLTPMLSRASLTLQKHSPTILTATGVAGVIVAGVMSSRATLKLSPILEQKREDLEVLRATVDDDQIEYSQNEARTDLVKIYARTGLKIVKLYGPSITLGALSIASILAGHGILRRRNIALTAAYKAVEGAYSEYRKRVSEEIGEGQEADIFHNVETIEVENEKGKKEKIRVSKGVGGSPYAITFDQSSTRWQPSSDYNLTFLMTQESIFNEQLHAKGHVFLNEVYDALGIPRTAAGQQVGWSLASEDKGSDKFIDFHIVRDRSVYGKDYVDNAFDDVYHLDFNVDGVILDRI